MTNYNITKRVQIYILGSIEIAKLLRSDEAAEGDLEKKTQDATYLTKVKPEIREMNEAKFKDYDAEILLP
ncbi:hypothetical protein BGZ90_001842 [Linnemannia elongata]|nr:hypothetical protein BGZ90_001842 [Linnemannia elongata]